MEMMPKRKTVGSWDANTISIRLRNIWNVDLNIFIYKELPMIRKRTLCGTICWLHAHEPGDLHT